MPGKRHSDEEIAGILKEWANGMTVEQAAKKHSVTVQSLYRWKRVAAERHGRGSKPGTKTANRGTKTSLTAAIGPARTLAELRVENARLKAIIADLLMEKYNAA